MFIDRIGRIHVEMEAIRSSFDTVNHPQNRRSILYVFF